jgi:hypothetical protein
MMAVDLNHVINAVILINAADATGLVVFEGIDVDYKQAKRVRDTIQMNWSRLEERSDHVK